jgi:NTP pyrophosphatase (non-canonical NTP hydrolase)
MSDDQLRLDFERLRKAAVFLVEAHDGIRLDARERLETLRAVLDGVAPRFGPESIVQRHRVIAREHAQFPAHIPVEWRSYFFALELCGEVGEMANQLKKQWRGDPGEFKQRVIEELRDAQCIILFLAEMLDDDVLAGAVANMLNFEKSEKWRHMIAGAANPTTG